MLSDHAYRPVRHRIVGAGFDVPRFDRRAGDQRARRVRNGASNSSAIALSKHGQSSQKNDRKT
jgi:hypothetical protein